MVAHLHATCSQRRWSSAWLATAHLLMVYSSGGGAVRGEQQRRHIFFPSHTPPPPNKKTRAGTVPTCHRAHRHGTARLILHSAVPGLRSRHGGTIRHDTAKLSCRVVLCSAVPCLAMPVPVPCRAARLTIYTYNLRSRPGRIRKPINLVSAMSGPPTTTLPPPPATTSALVASTFPLPTVSVPAAPSPMLPS
jgi:hypothetical protein